MSNTVHLVICFRPTVSLPDELFDEPEIQLAIDQSSPSPAQQTYSNWNEKFSEFLDMFYLQALVIGQSLFHVDSLLASKDILC